MDEGGFGILDSDSGSKIEMNIHNIESEDSEDEVNVEEKMIRNDLGL